MRLKCNAATRTLSLIQAANAKYIFFWESSPARTDLSVIPCTWQHCMAGLQPFANADMQC